MQTRAAAPTFKNSAFSLAACVVSPIGEHKIAASVETLLSVIMRGSLHFTPSARRVCRQALSWRLVRAFCAVWFTLTSVGFPAALQQFGGSNCASNPGQNCRCSITKRMSGTCCCSRDSKPQATKSCCSVKPSVPKLTRPVAPSCCPSKSTAQCVAATPQKVELSISRCDCGSEFPDSVSLAQEPRLSAPAAVISLPETMVAFVALPDDRMESALRQPPEPPPKIVL
jgi:hypothetical protein